MKTVRTSRRSSESPKAFSAPAPARAAAVLARLGHCRGHRGAKRRGIDFFAGERLLARPISTTVAAKAVVKTKSASACGRRRSS